MYQDPRAVSINQVGHYMKKEAVPGFKALQRVLEQLKYLKNDAETDVLIRQFIDFEKHLTSLLDQIIGEKNV